MAKSANATISDEDFMALWARVGGLSGMVRATGMGKSGLQKRRRRIEERHGTVLASIHDQSPDKEFVSGLPRKGIRAFADIRGTMVVASDCHWWPGEVSVAHKACIKLVKELQPSMLVLNGDLMDGARLCRQDPIGWAKSEAPTIKEELEALQERATELALAAGKRCIRVRTIGNHDIRLERYLAMNASEIEGLPGTTLDYYIPEWETTWSIHVNGTCAVKHRFANGVHAGYNNALKSGMTMVTGHLHRLLVTPWADYRGCRWGVDTGTLAEIGPDAQQFAYDEDNPRPWSSGFAVLTFDKNGMLLPPELAQVINGICYFRGKAV